MLPRFDVVRLSPAQIPLSDSPSTPLPPLPSTPLRHEPLRVADSCTTNRRRPAPESPPRYHQPSSLCQTSSAHFAVCFSNPQTAARFQTGGLALRRLFSLPSALRAVRPTLATAVVPRGACFFPEEPVPRSKRARRNCAPAAQATPESSFPLALMIPKQGSSRESQTSPARRASTTLAIPGPLWPARDFPPA